MDWNGCPKILGISVRIRRNTQSPSSDFIHTVILPEKVLKACLTQRRIEAIRDAIINTNSECDCFTIRYVAPLE